MQPFLAFVLPISGGQPDQGLPGQPPGVGVPGFPTHPIAPGGPPPGVWPQPPVGIWPNPPGGGPRPDQGLPGQRPPGIWGGAPSYPDQGLPPGSAVPPPQVGIPIFPGQLPDAGGGGGSGTRPDNSLPAGGALVLIYHPTYGWVLVKPDSITKPDQSLPEEELEE
ncbi:MAG: hypothetical protein ABWY63_14360 [Hyphomicrobiaceae bacterium]